MRFVLLRLAALLTFAFASTPALAWWDYGHRTVARIAWIEVSPHTRAEMSRLMAQSRLLETPECPAANIADLSVWPDCIKRYRDRFSYAYSWHFADVDICRPFDLRAACRDHDCVTDQIERNLRLIRDHRVPVRERLMAHRADPACAACHKMMDPIGFGLENFDWMGRWRDNDADGKPVNATGELPSGEKFNGPVELRNALLAHKEDFVRHVSEKVMGYALGRSLQDGDACTVQRIVQKLAANNYGARTLVEQIVLSVPFRNTQGGAVTAAPAPRAGPPVTSAEARFGMKMASMASSSEAARIASASYMSGAAEG